MVKVPLANPPIHVRVGPPAGKPSDAPNIHVRFWQRTEPVRRSNTNFPSGREHTPGLAQHRHRIATVLQRTEGKGVRESGVGER